MKVRINITPKDIHDGVQNNMSACPIARAVRRRVPEGSSIAVERRAVVITVYMRDDRGILRPVEVVRVPLTKAARHFVDDFDVSRYRVKPTSFTLDIPDAVLS